MKKTRGSILILVLVFGSIFFVILTSLASFVLAENRAQDALIGKAESFSIAEAGLTYYAWFLSHFPTDFQNGTGHAGPYVVNYIDPEGGAMGSYTLDILGSSACGSTQTVDISSKGVSARLPNISSTLVARYGTQSVAAYKQIVNDGSMPQINFSNLTPDYDALQSVAQANGIFIPRHELPQEPHLGYHLIFNSNGTVTVNKVTEVTTLHTVQFVGSNKFSNDFTLIGQESFYQTLTIPADCGIIFVEDNTWIEGDIPGKVTLVVSSGTGEGSAPDVILHGNITYTGASGSSGLTVMSEHNIMIAPDAPQNMTVNGIFVATQGYFGRNNYAYPSGGCTGLYEPRGTLTILGTIVSNTAPRTLWPDACGYGVDAGYQIQNHSPDSQIAANPPPFTPATSPVRQFINWKQVQ